MADIRSVLADYFNDQADWRAAAAREYPAEWRNAQSAMALRMLAEYVVLLPSNDPRLAQLDALDWALDGRFIAGENAGLVATRVGFGVPHDPHLDFDRFVEVCMRDADSRRGRGTRIWASAVLTDDRADHVASHRHGVNPCHDLE